MTPEGGREGGKGERGEREREEEIKIFITTGGTSFWPIGCCYMYMAALRMC